MASKVKDILKVKGNAVFSVTPETTVYDAIDQMCQRNIGGVVVMRNEKLAGIFTERDYARKLILKGRSSKETPIGDLMTSNLIVVSPDTTINHCMELMSEKRIRHLPVVEDERVVGMISIGDVVRKVIEDQRSTIEHLESYISGR